MQKISYEVGELSGEIYWAAFEAFDELSGRSFYLGEMKAVKIEKMDNLTIVGKILLSAVTGAVIQRLLDSKINPQQILKEGVLVVATV